MKLVRLALVSALAVLALASHASPLRADCGFCNYGDNSSCYEICACGGNYNGGICAGGGTCFCFA